MAGEAARLTGNFGANLSRVGRTREAVRLFAKAAEMARRAGEPRYEFCFVAKQGYIEEELGDPRRALAFYEQSRRIATRTAAVEDLALANLRLAVVHRKLGDYPRVFEHLERAKRGFERCGVPSMQVSVLNERGRTFMSMGDVVRARETLRIAFAKAKAHGLSTRPLEESLAAVAEDPVEGIGLLTRLIEESEREGRSKGVMLRTNLARFLIGTKQFDEVLRVVGSLRQHEDPDVRMVAQFRAGVALCRLGQPKEGEKALTEALAIARIRSTEFTAYIGQALIHELFKAKRFAEAETLLLEQIAILEEQRRLGLGLAPEMDRRFAEYTGREVAYWNLAALRQALGRPVDALAALERGRAWVVRGAPRGCRACGTTSSPDERKSP